MTSSQTTASGTKQKSISQGMPPGDPAQRAQINNMPLEQVPLSPNALIAGSQLGQASQGAQMQPQQVQPPSNMILGAAQPQQAPQQANPMTAAIAQHLQSLPPAKLAREAQRSDYMVHSYGTLARKPDLTLKDVISAAGQAIADGKATPEEATAEVSSLPQNPQALRAAIQKRFQAMIISASMLSGQRNAPAASVPVPGVQQ
jgi:hypothetical protein